MVAMTRAPTARVGRSYGSGPDASSLNDHVIEGNVVRTARLVLTHLDLADRGRAEVGRLGRERADQIPVQPGLDGARAAIYNQVQLHAVPRPNAEQRSSRAHGPSVVPKREAPLTVYIEPRDRDAAGGPETEQGDRARRHGLHEEVPAQVQAG